MTADDTVRIQWRPLVSKIDTFEVSDFFMGVWIRISHKS